jgi:hypothetical protein
LKKPEQFPGGFKTYIVNALSPWGLFCKFPRVTEDPWYCSFSKYQDTIVLFQNLLNTGCFYPGPVSTITNDDNILSGTDSKEFDYTFDLRLDQEILIHFHF